MPDQSRLDFRSKVNEAFSKHFRVIISSTLHCPVPLVTSYGKHNSGFALTVKRGEAESATIDAKVLFPEQTVRAFSITSKIYLVESKNYALPTKKELTYKTRTAYVISFILTRPGDHSHEVGCVVY